MGSVYLTEMASWLREAGVPVVEYEGWKTRSRSSGGYDPGKPWGVMWHHTASSTTPENDAGYMCHGSSDRPIANLLIARDGAVWVLAAGATNTNGKGSGVTWSRGAVPTDSMNVHAVGMEIANSGVGERFSQVQIDSSFTAAVTILQRLGLADTDGCHHQRYAPDRKIDPATAAAVEGPWKPRSSTSSGTWHIDDLISEQSRRYAASNGPPPPEENNDMTTPASAYLGTDLHVFMRGDDAKLYHHWYEGARWHDECLGGQIEGSPSAAAYPLDNGRWRVDVVAEGADGALWQIWYDGAKWSGWVALSTWPGG